MTADCYAVDFRVSIGADEIAVCFSLQKYPVTLEFWSKNTQRNLRVLWNSTVHYCGLLDFNRGLVFYGIFIVCFNKVSEETEVNLDSEDSVNMNESKSDTPINMSSILSPNVAQYLHPDYLQPLPTTVCFTYIFSKLSLGLYTCSDTNNLKVFISMLTWIVYWLTNLLNFFEKFCFVNPSYNFTTNYLWEIDQSGIYGIKEVSNTAYL